MGTVVVQGVMKKLLQQYEAFDVRNFKPLFSHQSEHGMPTVNKGVPCMTLETPFIIKCNYSAVTDMLNFIYDIDITPAQNASAAGQLWSVTQSAYLPALWTPETASVGSTAYAYTGADYATKWAPQPIMITGM